MKQKFTTRVAVKVEIGEAIKPKMKNKCNKNQVLEEKVLNVDVKAMRKAVAKSAEILTVEKQRRYEKSH